MAFGLELISFLLTGRATHAGNGYDLIGVCSRCLSRENPTRIGIAGAGSASHSDCSDEIGGISVRTVLLLLLLKADECVVSVRTGAGAALAQDEASCACACSTAAFAAILVDIP